METKSLHSNGCCLFGWLRSMQCLDRMVDVSARTEKEHCRWLGHLCDALDCCTASLEVTCTSLGPAGTRIIAADATAMYLR